MLIECGLPTVWDLLKWAVTAMKRPVEYAMSSKSFADYLRDAVRNLENEAERVHILEIGAKNNVRNFYSAFTEWQASAEKALKEARDLSDDFEKATKTCCYGTLPDPYCRYQFSTKAKAEIEVIQDLAQKCIDQFKELNDICFIDPAPGNVSTSTLAKKEGQYVIQPTTATASAFSASTSIKLREDGVFESRALIIQNIMEALANNKNSVVGVYGMGGVGKSTLLVDVERRIRREKSFDLVAKADVSENPNIKMIQEEIAHWLGLSDIKNEENVIVRAELLHKRLEDEEGKKKKVLIILDNLWEGLDLKSVGIPCRHDNKVIGCKLLLTSRDRNVLQREMGCDGDFLLVGLQDEEARGLFEEIAREKVHDEEFKALVDEALHKCAGFPFLIIAMAKYFKNSPLSDCKDALKQIDMSTNKGINKVINKMLQLSYDHLKGEEGEEAKSLLRLCVACGVSKPHLEDLVRYSVGLRLFREDSSMEEARDSLSSLIHTLQASSLLLDDEDAGSFKIHDLVRGFVTSVASRDHPILVLKDKDELERKLSKNKLKSCEAICFPYIDLEELPKELDYPKLNIFIFFTNSKSLEVPDSYFNSMRNIMVLGLTGIRLCHSLSPFQFLENLNTLCLNDCYLEDVAILGELKGLQILSLVNSNIYRLPKEMGQLTKLRLLDLNDCSQLQIIEPGVLGSLTKLEELYMEDSFDEWNASELTPATNASLIELNNMKNLCNLHVFIPDPSVLPKDLNVEKLTSYRIRIGNARHWPSKCKGSSTLELKLDPLSDVLWKGCIQSILGKSDDLLLDKLDGSEQSICALSQKGFPNLKHLQVKNSLFIRYILQSPSHIDFKMLESLLLKNLMNLEKICHNHISSKSFNRLKEVRVESCDKMEVLFPLSVARGLPQLEEIEVVGCKLMRGIIEADECSKVELHSLRVLKLMDLPDINNFLNVVSATSGSRSHNQVSTKIAFFNGQQVSIPSLESLIMKGLPNLKNIWSDESPLELSNLRSLEVAHCKSLSKIINSQLLVKLYKVNTLIIEDCISLQEIFDLDGPSGNGNDETIFELTTLKLNGMPSLRHRWNKNPCGIVSFQNLKNLVVKDCDSLEFMFFPSMIKSLAHLRDLTVSNCKKMEVIITEEEGLGMEKLETLEFLMFTRGSESRLHPITLRCTLQSRDSREARSQERVEPHSTALFNKEVAFPNLERLDINIIDNIEKIWDNQVAADSFHNLKSLCVVKCNKLVNLVPSCILGRLLNLESLEARDCGLLEVVFEPQAPNPPALVANDLIQLENSKINECGIAELMENEEGLVPKSMFPKLTSLKLRHLIELKFIYTGTHALQWPALKTLEVHGCYKVEIFALQLENEMTLDKQPLFLIEKGTFPNLQKLKLDLSKRMEIWHGHFHDEEFFCKLRVLELRHLSEESPMSICHFVESLTNLEKLVVCESYLEEPSSNEAAIEGTDHKLKVTLPFLGYSRHLQTLYMSHCDGLSNLFTSTIAENLVALTKLRISKCKILTKVISDEEGEEGRVVAFNQLKYMELDGLTKLRCFSPCGYTLIFPLLEDVIVNECPNMKFFSNGPIEAPKLERVQVDSKELYGPTKYRYFWKGNLNITLENMCKEMATVVGLSLCGYLSSLS
ncbi:putative disease resistance protein RGA3 [Eucalyptus grandis]|uniref:putative disease resistance protein RGA3 n=1 Tax=Eucalyptus grandis TaxID=71139 RepID=UPI00192EE409|nr:putative disease resistance protein RGA3 [Eucalyptus grandis]